MTVTASSGCGDGPTMLGTWVNTPSPDLVETLGDVGFDCVFLDLEHGEYGTEALPDLLRAARAAGCFGVVRTSARRRRTRSVPPSTPAPTACSPRA